MSIASPPRISDEQKRQYNEDGYFILERAIPDDVLEMLREQCAMFISKRNAEMAAAMTRASAEALQLKLFAGNAPAAALTAICAPQGVDSSAIVKEFRDRFAAVVANGQGEMKGKLFRIAHLGYYDYLDTIAIIGALEQVMAKLGHRPLVEFGSALRAAQKVYARPQP